MPKSKTEVNTAERATLLLEIVRRIPEHGFISCREIQTQLEASGFNVPTRKLQRYLDAVTQYEPFHVERNDKGKPFGYRKNKHVLGSTALSPRDCLLLRLAQEHMRYQMPSKLTLDLKPLFDEARVYINEPAQGREKKWLDKVAIVSNSAAFNAPTIRTTVFEALSRALFDEVMVEVKYFSGTTQEVKKHTVSPLGLVQQDVRMYLVCQFDGYDNVRTIALHRIESVKLTNFPATHPKKFNLKEYAKHEQTFNYDRGQWVELSFKFTNPITKMNLEETPFSGKGQTIKKLPKGAGWQLKAVVRDSRLIDGWLAMWKDDAGITDIKKKKISVV